jgi:hypothetical protein
MQPDFATRCSGRIVAEIISALAHAVALHYLHYNIARVHKTLCVTPAMEADPLPNVHF